MISLTQDLQGYVKEAYEEYSQWENWQNLLDMANAMRYGFSHYRLPKPGSPISVEEASSRIASIDKEWSREHSSRGQIWQKPCPGFSQCSIEAQCYLHSILQSIADGVGLDYDYYYGY